LFPVPLLTGRVRFADFELDLDTGELRRHGRFVAVQRQVARCLVMLVARAGHLVPREVMIEHLWGETSVAYDLGLNNTIRTLRGVLGDDARSPRFVETLPRLGYRFAAPVQSADPEPVHKRNTGPPAPAPPQAGRAAKGPILVPATALASALALAAASASLWVALEPRSSAVPAVAVVPFSGTGTNVDALGAGLAEELTRELTVVPAGPIRVIGAASAARAAREDPDLRRIAQRLGASHVVVGSFVDKGDALGLEVRVVRAEDAAVSWQDRIAPAWAEVLAAQRGLAGRIAAHLSRGGADSAGHPERAVASRHATIASYLRARHLASLGSAGEAIPLLEVVVRDDPDFVPGRTALAEAILAASDPVATGRASRHVAEALRRAPEDARAHLLRARIALGHEWDWRVAERHLSRALELAPRDATTHLAHAVFLGSLARHREALEAARKAQDLDPLSSIVRGDLAMLRFWEGNWEGVLRECARLLELEPEAGIARSLRLDALLRQRRWEEARTLAIALSGSGSGIETLAGAGIEARYLALQQRRWEAAAPSATRSMVLATIAAEQGRDDDAMGLLGDAVRRRSPYVPFLAVDPHFRPLARRADFRQLLAAVKHPLARSLPLPG
jgi:DNA-binding winged helix-turn-helix (wHTH) protein/TolB-like protein/Flp pilus assembly protein TadD